MRREITIVEHDSFYL